jgi:gluconolactonase
VPLLKYGTTAKVGNFIQLSGGGGPDGLALDSKGRIVVAHVGLGSVWVFDHLGVPVYRIKSCAGTHTTNMAFGGPSGTTLYIMEAGSAQVLTAELDIPGKPSFGQS